MTGSCSPRWVRCRSEQAGRAFPLSWSPCDDRRQGCTDGAGGPHCGCRRIPGRRRGSAQTFGLPRPATPTGFPGLRSRQQFPLGTGSSAGSRCASLSNGSLVTYDWVEASPRTLTGPQADDRRPIRETHCAIWRSATTTTYSARSFYSLNEDCQWHRQWNSGSNSNW